jgi:hypothetical protein
MKAIVYSNYGSPDVLKCEEIEKPTAGDDEVLIKVSAASVNPLDWRLMRGKPYILRISAGLHKPKATRLRVDVAGQVERLPRLLAFSNARPIVRAEWHSRQSGAIVKSGCRVGLPRVAGCHGLRDLTRRDDDRVPLNLGISPIPLAIFSSN